MAKQDQKDGAEKTAACRDKARQISEAARKLFQTQGYRATSMDHIAREADVSKTTLYAYHPSKEALFLTIVQETKRDLGLEFREEDLPEGAVDVRAVLEAIATRMILVMTNQSIMGFFRSVLAEAGQTPELGRTIWEAGPRQFAKRISRLFEIMGERGLIEMDDPTLATSRFVGLVRGDLHIHCLMDAEFTLTRPMVARHVAQSVDFFLGHYRLKT